MQFLNQHTSKYQKRSKHFVCTRFPGSSISPVVQGAYLAIEGDSYLLHTYNKDSKVQCPGRLSSHCMPRPTHCGTDVSTVTDSNVSSIIMFYRFPSSATCRIWNISPGPPWLFYNGMLHERIFHIDTPQTNVYPEFSTMSMVKDAHSQV